MVIKINLQKYKRYKNILLYKKIRNIFVLTHSQLYTSDDKFGTKEIFFTPCYVINKHSIFLSPEFWKTMTRVDTKLFSSDGNFKKKSLHMWLNKIIFFSGLFVLKKKTLERIYMHGTSNKYLFLFSAFSLLVVCTHFRNNTMDEQISTSLTKHLDLYIWSCPIALIKDNFL